MNVSDVAGGVLLVLTDFHLAGDEHVLCWFDLVVQASQKVAVKTDWVEHHILVGISR